MSYLYGRGDVQTSASLVVVFLGAVPLQVWRRRNSLDDRGLEILATMSFPRD